VGCYPTEGFPHDHEEEEEEEEEEPRMLSQLWENFVIFQK